MRSERAGGTRSGDGAIAAIDRCFAIFRYPITNSQYREFVRASGHGAPQHWHGGEIPRGRELHPVVFVTWHDANAYCAWVSALVRRAIWLPSEDYRAGTTTAVNAYPLGASPYGVMDMEGRAGPS